MVTGRVAAPAQPMFRIRYFADGFRHGCRGSKLATGDGTKIELQADRGQGTSAYMKRVGQLGRHVIIAAGLLALHGGEPRKQSRLIRTGIGAVWRRNR